MTREELIKIEGNVLTAKEFENVYNSEIIINVQNCGRSGLKENCIWVILILLDGTEVNLYVKD